MSFVPWGSYSTRKYETWEKLWDSTRNQIGALGRWWPQRFWTNPCLWMLASYHFVTVALNQRGHTLQGAFDSVTTEIVGWWFWRVTRQTRDVCRHPAVQRAVSRSRELIWPTVSVLLRLRHFVSYHWFILFYPNIWWRLGIQKNTVLAFPQAG